MLAGDQAAVLAESEESLQELVMRDAKARTDYRLRQNANDKGDGAGEAARCDHNADGEGKGWIGAGRPSEMDVGPGGQKAPRTEGCARFPPNRGGSHEGPDHHAWGGRGPGTRSGLSLPGMGEGSGEGTTTADRAGGGGVCERTGKKTLGFLPCRRCRGANASPRGARRALQENVLGGRRGKRRRKSDRGRVAQQEGPRERGFGSLSTATIP